MARWQPVTGVISSLSASRLLARRPAPYAVDRPFERLREAPSTHVAAHAERLRRLDGGSVLGEEETGTVPIAGPELGPARCPEVGKTGDGAAGDAAARCARSSWARW